MTEDSIAYQNKDIASKVFLESFGQKSLDVYGLHLPRIRELLPTNLPAIMVNELRMDNLCLLEDDSVAILDYESCYDKKDMLKYAKYLVRVADRYADKGEEIPLLRVIVIYTADVKRDEVEPILDKVGPRIQIEAAFLSELDSESIRATLTEKVNQEEPLTEEDMMEFIILPLSYPTREKKQEIIQESVLLATKIQDQEVCRFVLSGLLVFSDKVIDEETRQYVRRRIDMTQIGQMYLDRQEAAVRAAVQEAVQATREETWKEAEAVTKRNTRAEAIVNGVDNAVSNFHVSREEACHGLGYTLKEYTDARRHLRKLASTKL